MLMPSTALGHVGRQWNSRLAREILVYVPPELTPAQRVSLVRTLSQELADRYRNAVDFAVHVPRPQADQRHHHAHLLMTTREVGAGGLGARTTLDLSGTERHARGLGPSLHELLWMRERWAQVTNEALREAGLAARVDHRSYKDQGINWMGHRNDSGTRSAVECKAGIDGPPTERSLPAKNERGS